MTERRRKVEYVVERKVARAISVGIVTCALGNLLAFGCALAWLRAVGTIQGGLWLIGTAAAAQFVGGAAALIAFAWSR